MMKEIKSEGMWRNVEEARGKGESDDDSHGADGGRVLVVMVRITMMIKMMMMMVIAVMVMMVMMVTDGSGGIFVPFCVAVTKYLKISHLKEAGCVSALGLSPLW